MFVWLTRIEFNDAVFVNLGRVRFVEPTANGEHAVLRFGEAAGDYLIVEESTNEIAELVEGPIAMEAALEDA